MLVTCAMPTSTVPWAWSSTSRGEKWKTPWTVSIALRLEGLRSASEKLVHAVIPETGGRETAGLEIGGRETGGREAIRRRADPEATPRVHVHIRALVLAVATLGPAVSALGAVQAPGAVSYFRMESTCDWG